MKSTKPRAVKRGLVLDFNFNHSGGASSATRSESKGAQRYRRFLDGLCRTLKEDKVLRAQLFRLAKTPSEPSLCRCSQKPYSHLATILLYGKHRTNPLRSVRLVLEYSCVPKAGKVLLGKSGTKRQDMTVNSRNSCLNWIVLFRVLFNSAHVVACSRTRM